MEDSPGVVVVREFALLLRAQLAQMELGRHGIESHILDEHMASTAPFFAMDGGIRLAVGSDDQLEADRILCEWSE